MAEPLEAPPPLCLERLSTDLLWQIIGSTTSPVSLAGNLSATSRALWKVAADTDLVVRIAPSPNTKLSCTDRVVEWRSQPGALVKTQRLGHAEVCWEGVLKTRSVLLELDIFCLPSVGGVQLGLKEMRDGACLPACILFDGCGRVRMSTEDDEAEHVFLYGDRIHEGDRIGLAFVVQPSGQRCVGLTRDGQLMAPPVPLPHMQDDQGAGFRPFMRMDAVEGTEVRMVRTNRAPLDRVSLLESAEVYVPNCESSTLVRTVGPDSRAYAIPLDPSTATVSELQQAIAPILGCVGGDQVQLWIGKTTLLTPNQTRNSDTATASRTLLEAGLTIGREGQQVHDVFASLPHLIS